MKCDRMEKGEEMEGKSGEQGKREIRMWSGGNRNKSNPECNTYLLQISVTYSILQASVTHTHSRLV